MSIGVLTRPLGAQIGSIEGVNKHSNTLIFSSSGFATVQLVAHGRSTGELVYVHSNVEAYNGFKYVDVSSANFFRLRTMATSPLISFIKEASATIYFTSMHNWHCINLPIVYTLDTDLWPTNSADTVRTISTCSNSGGFSGLTLSGDIKTTGSAQELEFVKLTNTSAGGLFGNYDGVYQITSYTNDTTFTISLPYDNDVDLSITNASIQYYYNNYRVKVEVNGGIKEGHLFETQKPYEIKAVIDLTPDEDNVVRFSIHDILKSDVNLKNNLLLSTLPNNFDTFTMFYIRFGESYDVGGSSLGSLTPTYTNDSSNLEGFAVNAKLPFKNVYSGALSDYVFVRKFLTLFTRPTIFPGKYFDLSFTSEYYNNFSNPALSEYSNVASGVSWTTGTTPTLTLADGQSSKLLNVAMPRLLKAGVTYMFAYDVDYTGTSTTVLIIGSGKTDTEFSHTIQSFLGTGSNLGSSMSFTPNNDTSLKWQIVDVVGFGGGSYTFNRYWIYPLNDTSYFNDIIIRQGGSDIVVLPCDEGVYRQQLTDPSCPASSTAVTLYQANKIPLNPPALWTNFSVPTAFDIKGYATFTEVVTVATITPTVAITDLTSLNGETVRMNLSIVVTGDAVFTSGITVSLVLSTALGVPTSTSSSRVITANGTYSLNAIMTAFNDGAKVNLQVLRNGMSGGAATVVITVPQLFSVQKVAAISETKTIDIDCACSDQDRYISWLNPLGGFDYWNFKAKKDRGINIISSGQMRKNIFPTWPESYGEDADTVDAQTYRVSKNTERILTQHLTEEQAEMLSYIKTSPLVQIVNSIYDRRTVIVDTNSFVFLKEIEKLRTLEFNIDYTDDIPSQTL